MGQQSRVVKERRCGECGKPLLATADGLTDHSSVCKRMKAIGMTVGGMIERPNFKPRLRRIKRDWN